MNDPTEARKGSRNWLTCIRFVLALSLLLYVGSVLPWHDRLSMGDQSLTGTIIGDWKSNEIGFRFDPASTATEDLEPNSSTPNSLVHAVESMNLKAGDRIEVRRDQLRVHLADPDDFIAGEFSWQPGLVRVFSDLKPAGLLAAMGALFLAIAATVTRWWRLLAISGCNTPWTRVFRITYYGLFLNLAMPGLAGADILRSALVVRDNPHKRADALITVIVDRVLGFLGLLILALIAIFAIGERAAPLRLPILLTFSLLVVGIAVQQHPASRRILRVESILQRLPQAERLAKLDRALLEYARHPDEVALAIAISLVNHLSASAAVYAILLALGDSLDYLSSVCILTITNSVTALPITPGGWGVGEALYGTLFQLLGGVAAIGVATSVIFRLLSMSLGLLGGVFVLMPNGTEAFGALKKVRQATGQG